jgi:hypothetical protein
MDNENKNLMGLLIEVEPLKRAKDRSFIELGNGNQKDGDGGSDEDQGFSRLR